MSGDINARLSDETFFDLAFNDLIANLLCALGDGKKVIVAKEYYLSF